MGNGLILIANVKGDQVSFIARNNIEDKSAQEVIRFVTSSLNGNGGGSKTFAQGGGKNTDALEKIYTHIEKVLNNE